MGKLLNKTFKSNLCWLTAFALKKVKGWETEELAKWTWKDCKLPPHHPGYIINQAFVALERNKGCL